MRASAVNLQMVLASMPVDAPTMAARCQRKLLGRIVRSLEADIAAATYPGPDAGERARVAAAIGRAMEAGDDIIMAVKLSLLTGAPGGDAVAA